MPKKMKRHLINFLRVSGMYVVIMSGLGVAQILAGLIGKSDEYNEIKIAVTIAYFAISAWFCWRFYTGIYRDGDFLE